MLYEMARRYDEWPGEEYDGSSARGAMIGFVRHGVCTEDKWPKTLFGEENFTPDIAKEALGIPGGAYYRVMHKHVRDVHAALAEANIVYMTLMVHEGWNAPSQMRTIHYVHAGNSLTREIPVIVRKGQADGGHAVAIVGYTREGFIIQNSWGPDWGAGGFALLPYEDYMLHATDVWVVQLGVPTDVDLWAEEGFAESTAGRQRAAQSIPLNEIRPYVVNIGNNGKLSDAGDYWTTEEDVRRLFSEHIPEAAKKRNWTKKRLLLYLHGGLNDEAAVARRIVAFRDVCLENGIYPLHVMWETGAWETIKNMIADYFTEADQRAGSVGDWLRKTREGLIEAKDRTFEITTARAGRALWAEMKENARLASNQQGGDGGMQLIAKYAKAALDAVPAAERSKWELHVVAHSAGSIFAAHAIPHILNAGVEFKTLQFLAPAATTELFSKEILPQVEAGKCPPPSMYILSDEGERDDDVGPYGKSLLYLVSNAFEKSREMPLLGMEKFLLADKALTQFFGRTTNGLPRLVIAGASP
ncbi:MAG: C1 family peptidase, partial [Thermoanaerobaculia bacterium]